MVDPMVVSWGFGIEDFSKTGSRFVDFFQWAGTKDPAAYLSVPSAISFSKNNNWQDIRNKSKQYLDRTIADVTSLPGFTSIYADNENYTQLASIQIPDTFDVAQLKTYLYEEHKVELPVLAWSDKKMIRVSIQGYNTEKDIDALVKGLKTALRFFNIFETKMVE
jgi:isopenicillin-N epimerase